MTRNRRVSATSEEGFSLAEVLVALFVLALVAVAAGPFFYRAFEKTGSQGQRQAAVIVAGQTLDLTRGIDPQRLVAGRNQQDVQALEAPGNIGIVDLSQDNTTTGNYDPTAAVGSANAAIPLTSTTKLSSVTYTVRTYIDLCYRNLNTGICSTSTTNATAVYRISVDVAWPKGLTNSCLSGRAGYCEYVATSLRDSTVDPTFNRNVSQPVIQTATGVPNVIHEGQSTLLTMLVTQLSSGAGISSDTAADTVGATTTSATLATATFTAGPAGPRTLRITNTDGGNGSINATSPNLTVTQSAPTVTALTCVTLCVSHAYIRGTSYTMAIVGTDLYQVANPMAPVLPTAVNCTLTQNGLPPVMIAGTNVTVTASTAATFVLNFPTTLAASPTMPATPGSMTCTINNPDYLPGPPAVGTATSAAQTVTLK